jgi:flagellar biosynthetic protein FliQ
MSPEQVIELGRDLLYTALIMALPAMAASLVVGLVVSVLQTMTSIQEQTLSFLPRLLVVGAVMLLLLPFTLQAAVHFTVRMFGRAMEVGR